MQGPVKKPKRSQWYNYDAERGILEIERVIGCFYKLPNKQIPDTSGICKNFLFSGVWFCLDCWILNLTFGFLSELDLVFSWILVSDVKVIQGLLLKN